MMMSSWKVFLRIVAVVTGILILSNIGAYLLLRTGRVEAQSLEPLVAGSMFALLLIGVVWGLLTSEAARVPKEIKTWRLSFLWCPKWLTALSWSIAAAFFFILPSGKVFWDFADPLTVHAAGVITGTVAVFALLIFPTMISAVRMPGTYLQGARRISLGPNNALQSDVPRPSGSGRA